jgi:hypothetical protein
MGEWVRERERERERESESVRGVGGFVKGLGTRVYTCALQLSRRAEGPEGGAAVAQGRQASGES